MGQPGAEGPSERARMAWVLEAVTLSDRGRISEIPEFSIVCYSYMKLACNSNTKFLTTQSADERILQLKRTF